MQALQDAIALRFCLLFPAPQQIFEWFLWGIQLTTTVLHLTTLDNVCKSFLGDWDVYVNAYINYVFFSLIRVLHTYCNFIWWHVLCAQFVLQIEIVQEIYVLCLEVSAKKAGRGKSWQWFSPALNIIHLAKPKFPH